MHKFSNEFALIGLNKCLCVDRSYFSSLKIGLIFLSLSVLSLSVLNLSVLIVSVLILSDLSLSGVQHTAQYYVLFVLIPGLMRSMTVSL